MKKLHVIFAALLAVVLVVGCSSRESRDIVEVATVKVSNAAEAKEWMFNETQRMRPIRQEWNDIVNTYNNNLEPVPEEVKTRATEILQIRANYALRILNFFKEFPELRDDSEARQRLVDADADTTRIRETIEGWEQWQVRVDAIAAREAFEANPPAGSRAALRQERMERTRAATESMQNSGRTDVQWGSR